MNKDKSYRQILKSSVLIGGSSVANIGLGIIRTKALALLLGPTGVGLLGLFGSISDLTRSIAGMGINSSGVRQIAESVATNDAEQIAYTVKTLRRLAIILGTVGALFLVALSGPISRFTFGDDRHQGSVALLSLVVIFATVSASQSALVQGMRRIGDLARMSVLGGIYGTLFSIPIVYFFGDRGVAPFLVAVAGMGVITSWWYSRKIRVERVSLVWSRVVTEGGGLLKLGFVFMATGLFALGTGYLIRLLVVHSFGVSEAGYYQAAWTLAGLYVGFILQAMGADFYPRLTAVAKDNAECNRLVNEQAEVGLLLAGPGVLATLTFAPLVIELFYSAKFGPAIELLRWNSLGMLLQVISWPIGFILLAKNLKVWILLTEFLSYAVHVGLVWLLLPIFGLKGAGIGFAGLYVFHTLILYVIVRKLYGFRWSATNLQLAAWYGPCILAIFVGWYLLPQVAVVLIGSIATMLAGYSSLRMLSRLLPIERLPRVTQKLMSLLKLNPAINNP